MEITKNLSRSVAQIVQRLFIDDTFREDALANPELAFAHYSLDAEERKALRSLVGHMQAGKPLPREKENFWL